MSTTATTANHTGTTQKSSAFERILSNIDDIAEINPSFRPIAGPTRKALEVLHEAPLEDEAHNPIQDIFAELGEEVSRGVSKLKTNSLGIYNGLLGQVANLSDKLVSFLKGTSQEAEPKESDLPEGIIDSVIDFGVKNNALIEKRSKDLKSISFTTTDNYKTATIKVDKPTAMFRYIALAHKKNSLFNIAPDNDVKRLVYLALALKKYLEQEEDSLVDLASIKEAVNFKGERLSLKAQADTWNEITTNPIPTTPDFSGQELSNEGIQKREDLIREHNASGNKQKTSLVEPQKLLEFLKLTRQMEEIRPFSRSKNPDYEKHALVMQWYLELTNANPVFSSFEFIKAKGKDANFARNASNTKRNWFSKQVAKKK